MGNHLILQNDINPISKLFIVLVLIVSIFIIPSYIFSLSIFIVLLFLSLLFKVFKSFISTISKTLLILISMMFVMQALFYPGEIILMKLWIFSIKQEGIIHALNLSSKLLVIGGAILLFFKLIEVRELLASLESVGLSPKLSYVILSTLQIIPQMQKKANIILDTQRARGVETEGGIFIRSKAFIPTIAPLILGSIISIEERALTLEARAFSSPVKKTRLIEVKKTSIDKLTRVLAFIFLISVFIWRIFL
ncbi:energy-coupling factor transporter transmembrane component T [Cytobacillus sp. FJAT-54145]|uniref:Energy-coupling factor transporter transmembrane component T n=1 Tax=Cytobacillus spartinae TaxID=3299023 RepID=A0ABW6K6Q0_9BACI